jgi:hypothetical protein
MIEGTIVFAGNYKQPCLADFKLVLDKSNPIYGIDILLSENKDSNSTRIDNNEYSILTAVKSVLDKHCSGIRLDSIAVYYKKPGLEGLEYLRDLDIDCAPCLLRIPLKCKLKDSDLEPLTLVQKVKRVIGGSITRTVKEPAMNRVIGEFDYHCGTPYPAVNDFEEHERNLMYKKLCRTFELS